MKKFIFFALILAFIGNKALDMGTGAIAAHHQKIENAVNG